MMIKNRILNISHGLPIFSSMPHRLDKNLDKNVSHELNEADQ